MIETINFLHEKTGIDKDLIRSRIKAGWSADKIVKTPKQMQNNVHRFYPSNKNATLILDLKK